MQHRQIAAALAAALATTMVATSALAAAPAVPVTAIQPGSLERGADPTVAYTDRAWFVDGAVRVKVGKGAVILGRSGDDHLVGVPGKDGRTRGSRIVRVHADGATTVVKRNIRVWDAVVTSDGSRLVQIQSARPVRGKQRTRLRTFDAATGAQKVDRTMAGALDLLAASRTKVYFSRWNSGTFTTNARGRKRTPVAKLVGSVIDLEHDLLGGYTGDPYRKGCFKVVKLSKPGRQQWKSCDERVEVFNTDGTGFATIDILADGIGPSRVNTRTLDGTLTARYRTAWFGVIRYEDPTTVLLEANGRHKRAFVRCIATECENATDPVDTPNEP